VVFVNFKMTISAGAVPKNKRSFKENPGVEASQVSRRRPRLSNTCVVLAWICLACCLSAPIALAQAAEKNGSLSQLDQFSGAVQALAARVSPSVVRIVATRYASQPDSGRSEIAVGKQEIIGSGVIVDSDGYILTNAHVVDGAQMIKVNLVPKGSQTIPIVLAQAYARPVDATLVGLFDEADLALLKIDAHGLPSLPFADYHKMHQGEVVFAFGSPAGLQNSVSMGVVSSIARQLDPDSPLLYIQTDTPINPGSSGGPLVNTAAEIVGLNTFIFSQSGGNEGIGFAIPCSLAHWVYEQLRQYGHVHRPVLGVGLQTITPTLAAALKLPRDSGVLVSDVLPGSPAESAGLKLNDILLSVNGRPLENVAAMLGVAFEYGSGQHLKLRVLRGTDELSFDVVPVEAPHPVDRLVNLADAENGLVPRLGILGITVDKRTTAISGELRFDSGVIVAARVQESAAVSTGLEAGDVIHAINGNTVLSVEALRAGVAEINPGSPVAVLIERGGKLFYEAFEI
jgi:serine protease Do